MAIRTGPTNPRLLDMIKALEVASAKNKVEIWRRVASDLGRSTRIRREVTINDLNRVCNDKETIVVPGKVLGNEVLKPKITVAAWKFSNGSLESINKNGKAITLHELIKMNPTGNGVRIIG